MRPGRRQFSVGGGGRAKTEAARLAWREVWRCGRQRGGGAKSALVLKLAGRQLLAWWARAVGESQVEKDKKVGDRQQEEQPQPTALAPGLANSHAPNNAYDRVEAQQRY